MWSNVVFKQVQNYLVASGFVDVGTDEQKEKYLTRLCRDTVSTSTCNKSRKSATVDQKAY